jgi:hypothetical protein
MADIRQVRQAMLDLFRQWGMPKAIRSDNGEPFGVPTRDVIPIMSLWLAAWGIRHILNRPKRPTDNANVENNQRTSARWADAYRCANVGQLQERLDEAARCQREAYKVARLGGVTRRELFPDLHDNPRKFDEARFDENLAYGLLSQAIYPRKVSSAGTVALYSKNFSVGLRHKGTVVFCKFSPKDFAWLCLDKDQNILKTISDDRFSKGNLYNLTVCK